MKSSTILFLLIVCIFGIQVQAHDEHDWRIDLGAFRSARVDTTRYPAANKDFFLGQSVVVSEQDFRLKLEELTGVREVTINGKLTRIPERGSSAGRVLTRQWLAQEYRSLGFSIYEHNYNQGANFIAEKVGKSGKVLILSSHMDSVFNAGADDDGAGTVSALLVAKALKDLNNNHTLRILAFDNEEQGLIGSRAFVKTLDPAQILGDIQMEMMAYNSKKDGKFHVIDCDRTDSLFLTTAIMQAVQALELPLTRVKACTNRSDHAAFWDMKMPAVVLSENFFGGDGDVCYHRACDILDARLDLKYASLIATAVANAASTLLQ